MVRPPWAAAGDIGVGFLHGNDHHTVTVSLKSQAWWLPPWRRFKVLTDTKYLTFFFVFYRTLESTQQLLTVPSVPLFKSERGWLGSPHA